MATLSTMDVSPWCLPDQASEYKPDQHGKCGRTIKRLAADIQDATGQSVKLAYVDQGYTGETAADAAAAEGIALHVVKLPEAKRGFVLLPRRWS